MVLNCIGYELYISTINVCYCIARVYCAYRRIVLLSASTLGSRSLRSRTAQQARQVAVNNITKEKNLNAVYRLWY